MAKSCHNDMRFTFIINEELYMWNKEIWTIRTFCGLPGLSLDVIIPFFKIGLSMEVLEKFRHRHKYKMWIAEDTGWFLIISHVVLQISYFSINIFILDTDFYCINMLLTIKTQTQ